MGMGKELLRILGYWVFNECRIMEGGRILESTDEGVRSPIKVCGEEEEKQDKKEKEMDTNCRKK